MISFILQRRAELEAGAKPATGSKPDGRSHLNLKTTLPWAPHPKVQRQKKAAIVRELALMGYSRIEIASLCHTSRSLITKIAQDCKIDVIRKKYLAERGFHLPDDKVAEYRDLRALGLTTQEAGMCLGLIPRPS